MATIQEIIRRVDMSKPNAFGDKIKMRWLSLLDGKIAMNVLLLDAAEAVHVEYTREEDLAKEPLVSFPYDDIYDLWLSAQIDFYNGEYDRYQNSMEMFNAHYMDYVKYVADNFDPVQQGGGCCRGNNRFYLTAYGLAVKHGFAGTEEEWLVSLIGQAPVFQIGEVTTVPYGTPAAVSLRGTPYNPILDFAIPRGFSAEDAAGYCEQAAKSAEEAQEQAAAAAGSAAEVKNHAGSSENPHGVTASQAGALPALESQAYPGCYYRMVGEEKEWLNPPMEVDVEYRTTERLLGKPVYVKVVDMGNMPNATVVTKPFSEETNALGIRVTGYARSETASITIPTASSDGTITGLYCSNRNIAIDCNKDSSAYTAVCTVWYIKL